MLLPSAVGASRPSALVPGHDGRRRPAPRRARSCVVGLRPLQGLPRRAARRQPARAQGVPAARSSSTSSRPRRRQRARPRPRVRPPRGPLASSPRSWRCGCGRRARRRSRPCSGCATPHDGLDASCRTRLGRPVFEIPTLPPSVPGLRVDRILASALRAAGRARHPRRPRSSQPSPTRDGVDRPREGRRPRDRAPRATGSCSRPAASRRARSCSTRTGGRARPCSACRSRTCPAPASRASCPTTSTSSRWRAWASRSTRACGPVGPDGARVHERVLVAGASIGGAVPWKEHSGEGISVTTGYHAAGEIAEGSPRAAICRRATDRQREARMSAVPEDDVLLDLIRGSLDHCVKCTICETHCPYSNVTPLFPGPKYVGPQAERFRTARRSRPTRRSTTARAAASARRSARRACTSPRSTRAPRRGWPRPTASRCATSSSRGPTSSGALGTPVAPLANWTLRNRPLRGARRRSSSASTATPRCRSSPGRTFQRWAKRHAARRRRRRRSSSSTAAARTTTSPTSARRPSRSSSTTASRSTVPKQGCCGLPLQSNGIFPAGRGLRAAPGAATSRRTPARGEPIVGSRRAARS